MENWAELKRIESWQQRAWQNRINGKVLSLEQVGPSTYNVVTLPENFYEDNQIIEDLGKFGSYEQAMNKVQEVTADA